MNIRKISLPAAILSAALLPISTLVACSDDSSNSSAVEDPTGDISGDPDIGGGTVIPTDPDIGGGQVIEVPEAKDTTFLAPDEPAPEGGYTGSLTGVCEKGPFKAGSDVKLSFLDDALSPTGKSVSAKVADDFGKYTLQYSGMTSYAMLEATGAFLNDIMGDASASITLKSLIRAIDGDTANVNVMTHLEAPRIAYLMKENGMSYAEAQGKAESEVLKAFHMQNFTVSARNLSVLGSTDADGNLLAMSLLLQSEFASAEMQSVVDAVAADIEKDGTWDDATLKAKIADWAYMQRIDDLKFYLLDIASTLPSFDQKFRTFWFQEFGLGKCDSTIQGSIVKNTNNLSAYNDKDFICADSTWRIASASALQNREGEALFGKCTTELEGTYKNADGGKTFVCKKEKWVYASEADLLNKDVSEANGACNTENNGKVVKFNQKNVLCFNGSWKEISATPVDYSKGRAMNKKLGQGINLGNAWESKGTKGSSADCGWGNCIKDEYFKLIKETGFKSVRIPVRWNYDADLNSPYTIDNGRLSGVKADIDLALAQGLIVIVNFHHYEELNNYAVNFDKNPSGYENEKKRFLAMWEQVAKAMDTYGDDQVVLEILNEPHDMKNKEVDDLMMSAYEVIRKNAPGKTIMFEGNGYSKFAQISNVQLPADGNIIFTGHYYEPFSFTHQGHGYDCGTRLKDSDISKMPSQFKAYVDSALVHYPDINGGHIPLNMGEFGVSTCSGNGPTSEERAKWTDAAISAAESFGMSWHYWGLTGVGGFEAYSGSWNSNLLDVFKKYL